MGIHSILRYNDHLMKFLAQTHLNSPESFLHTNPASERSLDDTVVGSNICKLYITSVA